MTVEKKMVTSITATIEGKEITLTVDQARMLYSELKEMFGNEEGSNVFIPVYINPYPSRPWPYYLGGTWSADKVSYTVSDGSNTLSFHCE